MWMPTDAFSERDLLTRRVFAAHRTLALALSTAMAMAVPKHGVVRAVIRGKR
jgi:hypothetical protein